MQLWAMTKSTGWPSDRGARVVSGTGSVGEKFKDLERQDSEYTTHPHTHTNIVGTYKKIWRLTKNGLVYLVAGTNFNTEGSLLPLFYTLL